MRCTNGLPDKQTVGYTLLELVAISGCCGLITVTVCVDTG